MKLKHISLRGFIGIQNGIGLDEIDLDLSNMAGLIALKGGNGAGKTTLLENLQPFRTLPSRKSTLKSHCFLPDSRKELTFDFEGSEYRTLVKMNATTTTRDEGFIWKNGESVVDGKVTNYDKYIVNLMGSQSLFFNSIFSAQNAVKLSDLRPSELKTLFAEFLRLDRFVAWEATCKQAINLYHQSSSGLAVVLDGLNGRIDALGSPMVELAEQEQELARMNTELGNNNTKVKERRKEADQLKKDQIEDATNRERLKGHEADRSRLMTESERAEDTYRYRVNGAREKHEALERKKQQLQDLVANKDSILAAAVRIKEINHNMETLTTDGLNVNSEKAERTSSLLSMKREHDELSQKRRRIDDDPTQRDLKDRCETLYNESKALDGKIGSIDMHPDVLRIDGKIRALKKTSEILNDIDPDCSSTTCGLIAHAVQSKKELPAEKGRLLAKKSEIALSYQADAADLKVKIDAATKDAFERAESVEARKRLLDGNIYTQSVEISKIEDQISAIENTSASIASEQRELSNERDRIRPLSIKAPDIIITEARLKDVSAKITESGATMQSMGADHSKERETRSDAIRAINETIARLTPTLKHDIDEAVNSCLADIEYLQTKGLSVSELIAKTEISAKLLKENICKAETLQDRVKKMKRQQHSQNNLEVQWTYLRDACSKKGIQALEISGVAPVITNYANGMLSGTFGPNHAVRFEIQDKDGREVLDIVVIDGDGSEALLSNKSGGERVWILKALSLAQTMISQEKSGRHFESALFDEEDGALSNENAIKFIQLYRTLMNIAKMDSCLYISHRADAINMADHTISMLPGKVVIQ